MAFMLIITQLLSSSPQKPAGRLVVQSTQSNKATLSPPPNRNKPHQTTTMSSPVDSSVFLSLAPTTSDSYPFKAQQPSTSVASPVAAPIKRRTSSVSSAGSNSAPGLKFLKLGPVHYGEHPDEHKEDWHPALLP
ncbi:hypothetical protein CTRI78_v003211 [Colletotrichum trifolii]|uniref:Uncharacterized protein n=1 Tax=Colletotrichum trifolii TaxID=5466 RepID=A0A4V3HWS7_COLTR|nr:hypothetical protein CTRI78_v003211 [Colletotrichum trifolii]